MMTIILRHALAIASIGYGAVVATLLLTDEGHQTFHFCPTCGSTVCLRASSMIMSRKSETAAAGACTSCLKCAVWLTPLLEPSATPTRFDQSA